MKRKLFLCAASVLVLALVFSGCEKSAEESGSLPDSESMPEEALYDGLTAVSAEGITFTRELTMHGYIYRVFGADGKQIGPNYDDIECTTACEDTGMTYKATFGQVPPVPIYSAKIESEDKTEYWLLVADGKPIDDKLFESVSINGDKTASAVRDGNLYSVTLDGVTLEYEARVTDTFYDGKFQLYQSYKWVNDLRSGLLDEEGNVLAKPEYFRITMPFEDRYILYEGSFQMPTAMHAMLYSTDGTLLSAAQNDIGFFTAENGSCVGVAYAGYVYNPEEASDFPVYYDDGTPVPTGYWFTDREGVPISKTFRCIEFFINPAAQSMESFTASKGTKGFPSMLIGGSEVTDESYFLALTMDSELVKIPAADILLAR